MMNRLLLSFAFVIGLAGSVQGQSLPKTADITEDVSPDGSVNMGFQMSFDAGPWRQWKTMVGDEPARLRAMMRHQFAALTLENFKLERDDMNRVANMTMHSPVGPELRDDGSFQVPVDGYFRLINNAGRTWYFSGNNPNAGYTLNNVKVTLPANTVNAYVANPNNADQALVFALTPVPSAYRMYYLVGGITLVAGLSLFLAGFLHKRGVQVLPPALPRALPNVASEINVIPVVREPPANNDPVGMPPPVMPSTNIYPRPETPSRIDGNKGTIYNEPD